MLDALMPISEAPWSRSRFRQFAADRLRLADIAILVTMGVVAAAATAMMGFNLRIPGHAILRTVFPLALGLALVPRRGSGVMMSGSAAVAMMAFRAAGWSGGGFGALTSLLLTGPLLEIATQWSRRGWQLYLALSLAGLVSNLAAFFVRGLAHSAGGGQMQIQLGNQALVQWWPRASISYAICGLLAGLISAAICFRASKDNGPAGELPE